MIMQIVSVIMMGWILNAFFLFASWLSHVFEGKRNVRFGTILKLSVIPFSLPAIVIYACMMTLLFLAVVLITLAVFFIVLIVLLACFAIDRVWRSSISGWLCDGSDWLFDLVDDWATTLLEIYASCLRRHLSLARNAFLSDYEEVRVAQSDERQGDIL